MWHDCCEGPTVTQALLAELGSGPGHQEGVGWGEVCPPNLRTTRIYTLGWLLPPNLSPSRLFIWEVVPPVLAGMSIVSTPPPPFKFTCSLMDHTMPCIGSPASETLCFSGLTLQVCSPWQSSPAGRKEKICRTVLCSLQWCPPSTMCIT